MARRLVLASGSPQRRAILEQLGVKFAVAPPDVDEVSRGEPRGVVVENALRKARAVARQSSPGTGVLGVDTAVALEGRIFGKPDDAGEAEAFIGRLSGRTHEVHSGIALLLDGAERIAAAVTRVRFRPLERADVEWYVATGEWHERAGGYAIQGRGAALVETIEGDYSNVVGLPVAALVRLAPELVRA